MTNTIINNWKHTNLKDVLDLVIDHRGLTPKKLGSDWSNQGIETISAMNIKNGKIVNPEQIRYINNELYKKWMSDEIADGDVVMTSEAPLGEAYIIKNGEKYCLSQRLFALRPRQSDLNSGYLYYYLTSDKGKKELHDRSSGTTAQGIRQTELLKVDIPVPSLSSQEKIAITLNSLDELIDKTGHIIQKIELLKQGLMNELLTKGIGHKKFKKTKLGEIPEEWKLCSILDSDIEIIDGDRGVNYPNQHEFYSDGFCLFLSNRNIRNDSFDFSEPVFISDEKDRQLRKGKLNRWDVILTTRGTVGNVAIYDDSISYKHIRINSGMLIFRAGNTITPEFLYYLLKSPFFKERYIQLGSGSAQPQLPVGSLRNLLIPIPPKAEQLEIVKQLKLLDLKHLLEIKQLDSLLALKNGLMNDIFNQKVQI